MHGFHDSDTPAPVSNDSGPWYKSLNRYHWFVFVVSALGWLFDCLDQQLFILARPAAMKDLLSDIKDPQQLNSAVTFYGDIATSVFIAGWATGGLIFGMLGDRIGRAKTMMLTILIYSACTGLSALSRSVYDFAFYRFLTGLGVGGEFAVGVALVAEVMPAVARPQALATLQALSAVGNVTAALINMGLGIAEGEGLVSSPWRIMFWIGALPAVLALFIRSRLKEPDSWVQAQQSRETSKKLGSYSELFADPTLRKHALLGLVLACSGVIGLWAIGFYAPDLIKLVQEKPVTQAIYASEIAASKSPEETALLEKLRDAPKDTKFTAEEQARKDTISKKIQGRTKIYQGLTAIATNIGAFFGMFGFGVLSQRIGRKPSFVIALLAAFFSTAAVFWFMSDLWQIFVLAPLMGFCQLSLFSGYAMYFPELFPTRLRSTGTSFCYNVGRFVAAAGPLVKIWINSLFNEPDPVLRLRYGGVSMCVVFLVGLLVLPFLPETKGKPLPE
jgi:MFS family permease